jgi:GT2 family glycosyltransferase
MMKKGDVTIIVVPRDHFSDTKESLDSVFAFTPSTCPIIYVDGGSPPSIARYLRKQAEERHFELLRYDHYLTPNQARNIGAKRATSRYIVFIDNDVIVTQEWISPLVDCADATGAAVVGPLCYEERPLHSRVHFAGGDARIVVSRVNGTEHHRLVERIHKLPVPTCQKPTEAAEFHCMLVRTEVFRRLDGLDENMLSTRENIDFCLAVQKAGERVYVEPRSAITYLPPRPLRVSDVPFFALRWSDLWDLSSFQYFRDKWNLEEDEYFRREYRNLGWRRREMMMRDGVLRWLVSWRGRKFAERILRPLERTVNSAIVRRHARQHGLRLPQMSK